MSPCGQSEKNWIKTLLLQSLSESDHKRVNNDDSPDSIIPPTFQPSHDNTLQKGIANETFDNLAKFGSNEKFNWVWN